ncbi:hypothetical protein M777_06140 [Neisseria gonorrhoeae MU_NG8]|nr:hypothetical protein M777_06140 [Neisseria gonorrhoeae MU_NG8]
MPEKNAVYIRMVLLLIVNKYWKVNDMKNEIQKIMDKYDPWHEDDFESYEDIARDVSLMTDKTFIEHYLLEVYSEENGHFDQENVHAMIEEIKNAI